MANLPLPDITESVQIPTFASLARSGIYFLMKDDVVVYVGQAVDMRRRVADHIGEGSKEFDRVAFVPCAPDRLLKQERFYIEKLLPEYNACSLTRNMRRLGIESPTGSKLIGETRTIRLPRSNVRRKIEVFL